MLVAQLFTRTSPIASAADSKGTLMRIREKEKRVICDWIRADHSEDADVMALPDELLLTLHPEYEEVGPYPKRYSELTEILIDVAHNPDAAQSFSDFLNSFPTIMTNEYVLTAALKPVETLAKNYGLMGNGIQWLASLLRNAGQASFDHQYLLRLEAGDVERYSNYARAIYCSVVDEGLGASVFTPRELEEIKSTYQFLRIQFAGEPVAVSSM